MSIEHFSRTVAARRLDLEIAEAAHAEAKDAADQLKKRITAANEARSAITARRLAGEATEADAAEYMALSGDLEVLEGLHRDAIDHADAAKPDRERAALAQAEADLRRATEEAKHGALLEHARMVEKLLLRCVRAVQTSARQIGSPRTFGDVFQFDRDLTAAIRMNSWLPDRKD